MKHDPEHIPDKWRRIIQRVARGEEWRAAARAEACSSEYSKVIRTRMMKHPAVVREFEAIRSEARTVAVYGVVEAMAQAQKGIDLAEQHKNPMAYIKGCELRAKFSGLLVDRVEVVQVDLRGALAAAERRIIQVPSQSCVQRVQLGPASDQVAGKAQWGPIIAGAPSEANGS